MIRSLMYLLGLLLCPFTGLFSQDKIAVFTSGTEGHRSYRIPAIIALRDGSLLAFCEGRVNGSNDFGNIDIVLKKSNDHGKTWSAIQTVVDADSLQAGNPAPVVDMTDPSYPKGRIFLFYNTGNNHEGEVRKGKGLREVWYKTSADGGITWSAPVNITAQVHRPLQPPSNPDYHFSEDWRSYANTPGHAIQLQSGNYRGRLYVAANHSAGPPQPHAADYTAHAFFSDDHGKTFHLSDNVEWPGGNENMAVELGNGKLMLNFRNQRGDVRSRVIAISSNGGQHWDTVYADRHLPDPVCQGAVLSLGTIKGKSLIAFCNAADTIARNHLTLRISADQGKTWYKNILVDESANPSVKDFTAYSDITMLDNAAIGVLYERNGYHEIAFSRINWK